MDFREAFIKYVQNQKIVDWVSYDPYGSEARPFYGDGVVLENGYKYISFGGGCSGEDRNTTYIVSDKDEVVATINW